MSRIILYTIAYILTLGIYLVSCGFPSLEGFIFLSFLACTLVYTFSRESLPTEDMLIYPQAFNYKFTRVNTYGNGMLILLIISALIIAANYLLQLVSTPLIIFIMWPIIIVGSYILASYHQKRKDLYSVYDYVNFKLNKKVDIKLVKRLLKFYESEENSLQNLNEINPIDFADLCSNTIFLRETAHAVRVFKKLSNENVSFKEILAAEISKEK